MYNCSEPQNTATTLCTFLKNFLLHFHSDTRENAQTYHEKRKSSQISLPRLTIPQKGHTSHSLTLPTTTAQQLSNRTLRKILHNTRVAHPCVFAPDATHPAQSPLTQRGYVARPLGASAQAVKECGCRGEAAKIPR